RSRALEEEVKVSGPRPGSHATASSRPGRTRSGRTAELDFPATEPPAGGRAHEPVDVAANELHDGVGTTLAPHEHEVRYRAGGVALHVDDHVRAHVEAPEFGSLTAGDHRHDCRRTGSGLASQRELGIVGPQRREFLERPVIDQMAIACHQLPYRPFVVQVDSPRVPHSRTRLLGSSSSTMHHEHGSFATLLSITEKATNWHMHAMKGG